MRNSDQHLRRECTQASASGGKGSGSSYLVASDADLEVVQDPIDDMLQSEYGQAEQEMDGTTPPDTPASHLGPPAEPE